MADAFYSLGNHSELTVTAFDRNSMLSFMPRIIFAQFADKKQWNGQGVPEKGSAVTFTIHNSLNPVTGNLSETADPDAVNFGNLQKSVTLYEKGGLVKLTSKLNLASWDDNTATAAAIVGRNMAESFDIHARAAYDAQTGASYVDYMGRASKSLIQSGDSFTTAKLDFARTVLASRNVMGVNAAPDAKMTNAGNVEEFVAIMHPNVFYNLLIETGAGKFRTPREYADPSMLYSGETGMWNNVRILLTTNVKIDYNAGVATASSTVSGTPAAGATTVTVASGTNFSSGGGTVTITTGGVKYAYTYTGKSTNDLTIDKCISIDGVAQYRATGSGLVVAGANGDAAVEGVHVYTTYILGYQAAAYGYHQAPGLVVSPKLDYLQRIQGIGWKGYYGFGELRPESLFKVFSSSTQTLIA